MQQPVTSSRTLPRLTLPASISPEPEEMRTSDVIDIDGEVEASREKRARERDLQLVVVGKTQVLYNDKTKMYHCPTEECPYEHSSQ